MSQKQSQTQPLTYVLCIGLGLWGFVETGPLMVQGHIQWLPALALCVALGCALQLLPMLALYCAGLIEWYGARQATGREGQARWANWGDFKADTRKSMGTPFWGLLAGSSKSLLVDFVSNALVVAPAGSGKTIFIVIVNIFCIRASKIVADFKGELACVCAAALKTFYNERVLIFNPSDLWTDVLGESERYSPLDIIVDELHMPGCINDVFDTVREMAKQIFPEPAKGGGENVYFRNGGRRAIEDAALIECIICGYEATLSSVALLIEDRHAFERHMRWILGVDLEGKPLAEGPMPIHECEWVAQHDPQDVEHFIQLLRARATNWLSLMGSADTRTFDAFASGAQQHLAPFSSGRVAAKMRSSTFSLNDLKDELMTLFFVSDASRPELYKAVNGLMQWCAMTAMKRHPKKDVPVYFILDEATNYYIEGLATSLLTWGRSYGLRLLIVFQDFSAYQKTYGDKALETLLSETEIKLFLPGQRSPSTLERIKKLIGNQSIAGASHAQKHLGEAVSENVREQARALADEDEIRTSRHGILIVRDKPAALVEPVSYAQINPFRDQAGINPFHGKPFKQRVRVKLKTS